MIEELARVLNGLDILGFVDNSASTPGFDRESLEQLIHELAQRLEDQDTEAVEFVAILEQSLSGSEFLADAKAIGAAVLRYDFTEALERVHRLSTRLNNH